ncbi:ATP-binding protein [Streptomyces sp. NPDC051567]|uniref:ATP-binding protein n=1 Tax=Streptomyces sp. NPDC051567 TaxID=3365660 RepID=UPI0037A9CA62
MSTFTTCQTPLAPDRPAPASPHTLSYSLTLPGEAYGAAVARSAVAAALHAHHLDPLAQAAAQVTGELVAAAWRVAPGEDHYLSVRYRDASLRLIVYDAHAVHTQPRLAGLCEARRRATLRLLGAVVRECGGDWGFGPSREPGGGTRTWASLPHTGAAAFGAAA